MKTLQEIPLDVRRQTTEDLRRRALVAVEHLREAVIEAYLKVKTNGHQAVNRAGGSATSIVADLEVTEKYIRMLIGGSRSNDYLKFREFGIKPASGAEYPAFKRIPPPSEIAKWLRRGRIPIPEKFKSARVQARNAKAVKRDGASARISNSAGAIDRFAWAIAISMKRKGRPALRVIEKTARAQAKNIQKILQGA